MESKHHGMQGGGAGADIWVEGWLQDMHVHNAPQAMDK